MASSFVLKVVRVKALFPWAIQATFNGESRYRGYHYKSEAEHGLEEWGSYNDLFFAREFAHNFYPAEKLGIKEVLQT